MWAGAALPWEPHLLTPDCRAHWEPHLLTLGYRAHWEPRLLTPGCRAPGQVAGHSPGPSPSAMSPAHLLSSASPRLAFHLGLGSEEATWEGAAFGQELGGGVLLVSYFAFFGKTNIQPKECHTK